MLAHLLLGSIYPNEASDDERPGDLTPLAELPGDALRAPELRAVSRRLTFLGLARTRADEALVGMFGYRFVVV